jgi:hypothetical protein
VANNVASQVPVHANLVLASNTFTNLSRLPFLDLNLGGSIVIDHASSQQHKCRLRPPALSQSTQINRWNQTLTVGSHNTTENVVFNKPPFEHY